MLDPPALEPVDGSDSPDAEILDGSIAQDVGPGSAPDAALEDGGGSDAAAPDNCSMLCQNAHGSAACVDGMCLLSCALGYADCDGTPQNGCETDTARTPSRCGGCSLSCINPNGAAICSEGLCTPSCAAGFDDCDGDATNGCEADLASAAHCRTCDASCSNAHGSTSCGAAGCVPVCAAGYADCDGDASNGCETNTASDPRHCGTCPNACGSNGQICVSGMCQASPCAAGRGECDGNLAVTCETDTTNTLSHCGFCGNACSAANGTPACNASTCQVGSCSSGFGNCDGNAGNGCEARLTTSTAHCGACNAPCSNAHGTTSCSASACVPVCGTGYGDCDTSRPNGCETALNSVSHCGMCGRSCPANGGTPICSAGVCSTQCNLSGTFALKLTVQATWPNDTWTVSGSGTFELWLRFTGTHSGNTLSGTLLECGRYVPPFRAVLVAETYSFQHPNSRFDFAPPRLPTSNATISLSSASPGATLTLPRTGMQMGTRMADPANGSWPSASSGLTQVDDDMDGKPGVTLVYENGGGYDQPATAGNIFAPRADLPYSASRVALSLGGALESCTRASGSAVVNRIDTRIFGCKMAGSSQECSGSQASFLDQNCVNYTLGTASYTLLKIADGANCAAVRAALP